MSSTARVQVRPHTHPVCYRDFTQFFVLKSYVEKKNVGIGSPHQYTHSRQCWPGSQQKLRPLKQGAGNWYSLFLWYKYTCTCKIWNIQTIPDRTWNLYYKVDIQVSGASHSHISEFHTTLENQFTKLKGCYKNNNVWWLTIHKIAY